MAFWSLVNTLRPRQNGHRFADDTFKRIFLNENVRISIRISLKFVPKGPINNNPALVQIMAWRRPGDKPLSEPMMASLLRYMCVTRPQWVKKWIIFDLRLHTFDMNYSVIYTIVKSSFSDINSWTDICFIKLFELIWMKAIIFLLWMKGYFEHIVAGWQMYASVNSPSLVQIMASGLVSAKPLSEPMLEYYSLDP